MCLQNFWRPFISLKFFLTYPMNHTQPPLVTFPHCCHCNVFCHSQVFRFPFPLTPMTHVFVKLLEAFHLSWVFSIIFSPFPCPTPQCSTHPMPHVPVKLLEVRGKNPRNVNFPIPPHDGGRLGKFLPGLTIALLIPVDPCRLISLFQGWRLSRYIINRLDEPPVLQWGKTSDEKSQCDQLVILPSPLEPFEKDLDFLLLNWTMHGGKIGRPNIA